tara:strand:+ start:265 stop:489 length:225 start_codon:yes stop_codon:yes gene_type:complete
LPNPVVGPPEPPSQPRTPQRYSTPRWRRLKPKESTDETTEKGLSVVEVPLSLVVVTVVNLRRQARVVAWPDATA